MKNLIEDKGVHFVFDAIMYKCLVVAVKDGSVILGAPCGKVIVSR